MKKFPHAVLVILCAFSLTGCGFWDSIFGPPLTPPPVPTSSPYTYTPYTAPPASPTPSPTSSPLPTGSPSPSSSPTPTPTFTVAPLPTPIVLTGNCLVGSWRADETSVANYMNAIFPNGVRIPSGSMNISFAPDGTFLQGVDHLVMQTSVGGGGGELSMEVNGSVHGNYQNTSPTSVTFSGIADSRFAVSNVTLNGTPVSQSPMNFNNSFVNEGTVMNHLCAGNTLTVSWELQGKTLTLILARVS